jgi:D-3-phosphoglycerate dehydrogenase
MQVLVNKPIHATALEQLGQTATVLTPYSAGDDELRTLLHDIDAILLCAGFSMGPAEMDLAPQLKVIGRHGVGLDNVDVRAATERGIPVVYTPYGPTESTAEHTFLLMLATARRLPLLDRAARSGNFDIRNRPQTMGVELYKKTLGLVGFGRIGRRVADMCRTSLDMRILVYDPYLEPEAIAEWGANPVDSLLELASQVDILTLHIPATPETHHLIDQEVLQALGPRAILINAARGAVVDNDALARVLRQGRIFGAGIDVYDPEPPTADNPLFALDNVVLTPHIASRTEEGRILMGTTVVQDILRVLEDQEPEFLANPSVWAQRRSV